MHVQGVVVGAFQPHGYEGFDCRVPFERQRVPNCLTDDSAPSREGK